MTRNVRFGWWSLLLWLLVGLGLEALHGFKAPVLLDVGRETRREMWRLAHAHGALLALVNVVFGLHARDHDGPRLARASWCLLAAAALMPLGFVLGGLFPYGADPGLGVVLVPAGAVALAVGVAVTARRHS